MTTFAMPANFTIGCGHGGVEFVAFSAVLRNLQRG